MATNKEGGQLSLLALQSRMKCDPQGYEDELLLQLRHFQACLSVFQLQSSSSSTSLPSSVAGDLNAAKELAEMTMFLAHVTPFYPQHLRQFPHQILGLLRSMGDSLQPNLRRQLTQALILLRNRQMIELVEILPVLMELQTLGDRALRKLALLHIVQDIRRMNLKHRNEAKNKALQNVLFHLLEDENEARSKRALIVLCDLHRRKLWVDERTANAICNACLHKSSRIMKAALSFLLGYEQVDDEDEAESSDDDAQEHNPSVALSREAVYKAHHKGTTSSRRKKQAKLQRVMRSLKKQQRSQAENSDWSTSPLQQLHDPQGFAEKLFSCLQNCNERFEVKLMMMTVISRAVGLHRLILLNFYPFLQKYVQPHQRDVTHVLASAVQACHDMVPPDAVESLLRQLVNQFVHDRARPEVIAVGLNVVREICVRMPLIMTRDLLHDLAMYKKSREKAVSSAARSIVTVFRQVFPSLLEKKDRGKGADLLVKPKAFGENVVPSNVPGIELLASPGEDSEDLESSDALSDDGCDDPDGNSIGQDEILSESGEEEDGEEDEEKEGEEDGEEECEDEGEGEDESVSEMASSEEEDSVIGSGEDAHSSGDESQSDDNVSQESREKRQHDGEAQKEQDQGHGREAKRQKLDWSMDSGCSLRELKRIVGAHSSDHNQSAKTEDDCILSNEDFKRIKKLQAKKLARAVLAEHGIGKQGKKKEEALRIPSSDHIHERRVNPASLEANIRRRREKEERIASVRAGQEERGVYRSRASVKQKKTGGLTNRQKEKRKSMPLAAKRATAAKSRNQKAAKRRSSKQFRGKKAWKQ